MKALTVHEPTAFLLFHGLTHLFERATGTDYRGTLVICTHGTIASWLTERLYPHWRDSFLPIDKDTLPRSFSLLRPCLRPGMALGLVDLAYCVERYTKQGSRTVRTHVWMVENPRSFTRPFRIKQPTEGLCDIDDALIAAALGTPASQENGDCTKRSEAETGLSPLSEEATS